jgi:hypothetical protein
VIRIHLGKLYPYASEFLADETAELLFLSVEHVDNYQVNSFIGSLYKNKGLAKIVVDDATWR